MSDVYPGHNGMVGSVIIMLVVVYLSTNQGGVFEYDPPVSTVVILDMPKCINAFGSSY